MLAEVVAELLDDQGAVLFRTELPKILLLGFGGIRVDKDSLIARYQNDCGGSTGCANSLRGVI